jgi:hypothetical protein
MSRKSKDRRMNMLRVKNDINHILFNSSPSTYPDKQLLTIIIDSKKAHHFNFLKGFTEWHAVGTWKDYPNEHNTVIEVEYHEDKDESNGKRLRELLRVLNSQVIGEDKLYMRTEDIAVSSL